MRLVSEKSKISFFVSFEFLLCVDKSSFELELLDIFQVEREGEEERYKKFAQDKNRKLLWHGSRSYPFSLFGNLTSRFLGLDLQILWVFCLKVSK